jgi:MerR family transcriptional regulator, light-induced transcriptional regulator
MSFSIKDLETLSGVKAHTIRIWEQRFNLLKPKRTDTNIRYYDNEDLKNLLNVALLNKYGFKISHITNLAPEQVKEKILLLSNNDAIQERIITSLIQSMVEFDSEELEKILDTYIQQKGIERTITQIIFPFLKRVGIMWQTNHIIPAQEHLISNIIRQRLILATQNIVPFTTINKTILIFAPETEYHELGLLYVNYLLKSKGVRTVYLGVNVPIQDLPLVISIKKPDYLYTHITGLNPRNGIEKFIAECQKKINKQIPIIVSGRIVESNRGKFPANFVEKGSLEQVIAFINEL